MTGAALSEIVDSGERAYCLVSFDQGRPGGGQNIGHELTRVAKYSEAIEPLEKAVSLKPDDFESVCDLVNALAISKNTDRAIYIC